MQLRNLLDAAGFGTGGNDITNGFKLGLVSPDVPIAVNNPNAKPDMLYLFIPENDLCGIRPDRVRRPLRAPPTPASARHHQPTFREPPP